ncbi:NAD(P)/FAD-dependent oxidoreductase, partial [Thermocatellispora tengchongensis]|uniref:NAD(P)/FAD-dependent oxidoreductase n=1 Tax=Thermocatellispora tengchongensis TaxID=1073253 RepID=UPI0031F19477
GMVAGRAGAPAWVAFGVLGVVVGAAMGPLHGHRAPGAAVAVAAGMTAGLLGWMVWFLTGEPLLRGEAPEWSAEAAGRAYRELVGCLLSGGLTGALYQGAALLVRRLAPPAPEPGPAARVVVVGGGFAGVAAARRFERLALRGHRLDVTLVSASNYLLFTPMLAEVASGALQARHISAPVRAAASHTRFRHGTVEQIDPVRRTVTLDAGSGRPEALPYDHLVLAVGSVAHAAGLPGVDEHAFTLKDLGDARVLRDHVLALLERADLEPDDRKRRQLLTFVVAGGGFAGTEAVAELFDLVHSVLPYYPGIGEGDPRFVLVHSGAMILPELPPELGAYALERLRARGIEVRLGVRAAGAGPADVRLTSGELISTRTFVWTAGQRANPLAATLPAERGRGGALVVDATMRVPGLEGVWAVGDCARIPAPDGGTYPPTAQHAQREGRQVADNIAAVVSGRAPRPFAFRTLGVFVALGHRTAAGEIRGRRFSGLAAWMLWRGIYLAKLPGIEKRARVLFDWALDLAFPRDIAVTAPPAHRFPAAARFPRPEEGS